MSVTNPTPEESTGHALLAILLTVLMMALISLFNRRNRQQGQVESTVPEKQVKTNKTKHSKRPGVSFIVEASFDGLKYEEELEIDGLASSEEIESEIRSELGISETTPLIAELVSEPNGSMGFPSASTLRAVQGEKRIIVKLNKQPLTRDASRESSLVTATKNKSRSLSPSRELAKANDMQILNNDTVDSDGNETRNIAEKDNEPTGQGVKVETKKNQSSQLLYPDELVEREVQRNEPLLLGLYAEHCRLVKNKVKSSRGTGSSSGEDGNVTEIHSSQQLQEIISRAQTANRLVLIDFFATWCGPCRRVAPALLRIAQSHVGRVWVVKVDVDQNRDISSAFGIRAMPTFHFVLNGRSVATVQGANENAIIAKVGELAPPKSSLPAVLETDVTLTSETVTFRSAVNKRIVDIISNNNKAVGQNVGGKALSVDCLVTIRLWLGSLQSSAKFQGSVPILTRMLTSDWPVDECIPILDAIRYTLLDEKCAEIFCASRDLLSAYVGYLAIVLSQCTRDSAERKFTVNSVTVTTTLAWRGMANLLATLGSRGGKGFKVVLERHGQSLTRLAQLVVKNYPLFCGSGASNVRGVFNVLDAVAVTLHNMTVLCGCAKGVEFEPNAAVTEQAAKEVLAAAAYGRLASTPFISSDGVSSSFRELQTAFTDGGANGMAAVLVKVVQSDQGLLQWVNLNKTEYMQLLQTPLQEILGGACLVEQRKARSRALKLLGKCCEDQSTRWRFRENKEASIEPMCEFIISSESDSNSPVVQMAQELKTILGGSSGIDHHLAASRRTTPLTNPWA